MKARFLAVSAVTGLLAATAGAQVIHSEGFESGAGEWLANGQPTIFNGGGNPGDYIGVPYGPFWGVELRNETAGSAVTGDLTRHGGPLEVWVDVQVFALFNFFNKPMDPGQFPLVLEFVDYPAAGSPDPVVSVYRVGAGMPQVGAGWATHVYDVPDPTQTALPPGWGGTGAEDPVTFEPILPPGRTYRSVMENVDEVRVTTMVPGYFYASSFWEAGFDNVKVQLAGTPACYPDCNGDAVLNLADFGCFQTKFATGNMEADCNGDSLLNLADFGCFQTKFAIGCP